MCNQCPNYEFGIMNMLKEDIASILLEILMFPFIITTFLISKRGYLCSHLMLTWQNSYRLMHSSANCNSDQYTSPYTHSPPSPVPVTLWHIFLLVCIAALNSFPHLHLLSIILSLQWAKQKVLFTLQVREIYRHTYSTFSFLLLLVCHFKKLL